MACFVRRTDSIRGNEIHAEVDLGYVERVRQQMPVYSHRRPEMAARRAVSPSPAKISMAVSPEIEDAKKGTRLAVAAETLQLLAPSPGEHSSKPNR